MTSKRKEFALLVKYSVFPSDGKNYTSLVFSVIYSKKARVICQTSNLLQNYNFQAVFRILLSTQTFALFLPQSSLKKHYRILVFQLPSHTLSLKWQFFLYTAPTDTDTSSLDIFLQLSSFTLTSTQAKFGTKTESVLLKILYCKLVFSFPLHLPHLSLTNTQPSISNFSQEFDNYMH
jgi:hypothetical protein